VSTQAQTTPWTHLKSISRELFALDEAPLIASHSPFPWEQLREAVANCFKIKDLEIHPGEFSLREKETFFQGIPSPHQLAYVQASGLTGFVAVVFSESSVQQFMTKILNIHPSQAATLPKEFTESFFHFLTAETLFLLNKTGFDKASFALAPSCNLPEEPLLCQDIHIAIEGEQIIARAILSSTFKDSWKNYITKSFPTKPSAEKLQAIPLIIHIEAGRTPLLYSEFIKVKAGDVILIEKPFFDPDEATPGCMLSFSGRPLFHAAIQENGLQILEIPSHQEVYNTMTEKLNMNSHEEDIDDEIEEDEEDPFTEEEDTDDYELTDNGDENIDDDIEEGEGEGEEIEEEPKPARKAPKPAPAKAALKAPSKPQEENTHVEQHSEGMVSLKDIPITLVVELAQVEIPAQKLLEMQPGNLLDLKTTGSTALLTINNKIVGKGEIVKIGDTLGVRILELGA
jgi:flagellar motor switch protein FliN